MKKIMILQTIVSIVLLMFSCTQNRQEKGAKIAKIEVNKILTNAKSYEPVETEVDSAFTSIYTDKEVVKAAYELVDLYEKYEEVQEKYNKAKSSAAIWEGSYMSTYATAYAKEKHKQATEKMNKYASQLNEIEDDIISQNKIINERAKEIDENIFYGWNIYHRFRYANGLRLCDLLIIVDENMENVICQFILDDDNYSFDKLKKNIDKVIHKNER